MKIRKLISFLVFALELPLASCGVSGTSQSEGGQSGGGGDAGTSTSVNQDIPYEQRSVAFHYQREDDNYEGWNLWLWEMGYDGDRFDFSGKDSWGMYGKFPLTTWNDPIENGFGFLVRLSTESEPWARKDVDADRFIDFICYDMDENGVYNIYLKQGDPNIYIDTKLNQKGFVTDASITKAGYICISGTLKISEYTIYKGEEVIETKSYSTPTDEVRVKYGVAKVEYDKSYHATVKFANGDVRETPISLRKLFKEKTFNDQFYYDGELGAIYTKEKTTFKVWSPISSAITLRIYDTGTPASLGGSDTPTQEVAMTMGEKGVYSAEVTGDLEGKYYTYVVTNGTYTEKEVCDPYAKSAGVNGLRGMVVDFAKTNPQGWDEVDYLHYDRKELTVYETHVADVTSSATWTGTEANRKKFKGMYESGTTYTEGGVTVKTGFDHIKELGVNAVQILPFFDQANDEVNVEFNWGYNPLNYNVVEGCYSSDPYDGYVRIREMKELIKAYHDAGIEIIMDVVYNHVAGALGNNLDVLFPDYYYRYDAKGKLSNGSGCGNETESQNKMFRKFMIDSASFWLKEYKLGGFRFDLMGLHDLTTMNELAAACKEINPYVTIYGEPWSGGTSTMSDSVSAKQVNGNQYVGYGQFNDQIRNALHGGVFDDSLTKAGWINDKAGDFADMEKITNGLKGTTWSAKTLKIEDPDKTTNYVTCHDNRTLYDRLVASKTVNPETQYEEITQMITLAHSIVFLSQGTSFMLAGEEFARTKDGNHNSYNASYEVNELDYSLKVKNIKMFENFKELIHLKQTLEELHKNAEEVAADTKFAPEANSSTSTISYSLGHYKVFFTNGIGDNNEYNLAGYELVFSSTNKDKVLSATTKLDKYETLVVRAIPS